MPNHVNCLLILVCVLGVVCTLSLYTIGLYWKLAIDWLDFLILSKFFVNK